MVHVTTDRSYPLARHHRCGGTRRAVAPRGVRDLSSKHRDWWRSAMSRRALPWAAAPEHDARLRPEMDREAGRAGRLRRAPMHPEVVSPEEGKWQQCGHESMLPSTT